MGKENKNNDDWNIEVNKHENLKIITKLWNEV